MKKTVLFICMMIFVNLNMVLAQEFKQESDLIKSIVGKAKKDFVASIIDIPAGTSAQFWEYYNEYETQRQDLANKRINLIAQYTAVFDSNDRKDYKSIISEAVSLSNQNQKLIKKYYTKISKNVDAKTALQFFQTEEYLRTAIDNKLYANIPMNR